MKLKKKVVAIIVTYNRLEKLKKCWSAIARQNIYGALIVNNNSTDGTKEWIDSIDDVRLKPLHLENNIGGAGGFRKGCEYGLNVFQDAEWFLLFDDDAYAQPHLIENFFKTPVDSDLVSTKVLTPTAQMPKMNTPLVKVPKSIHDIIIYMIKPVKFTVKYNKRDTPVKVAVSSFVGLFISHECLKQMQSAIRPEFFMYCDDAYFTYQTHLAGYTNFYFPNLLFFHDISASQIDRMKLYYLIRNDVIVKRVYSPKYFYFPVLVRFLFYAAKVFRTDKTWLHLPVMTRALIDGLKNNFLVSFIDYPIDLK